MSSGNTGRPVKTCSTQAVVVTGAAGGLGYSISEHLLALGAKVVLMDSNSTLGEQAVDRLRFKHGEESVYFSAGDVTSEEDAKRALQMCTEKFGKLDVLINNAGIWATMKTYDPETGTPHDLQTFERILRVNTVGTFNMSRLAVTEMVKNTPDEDGVKGLIINISSSAAMNSTPLVIAYTASKSAISGMTLAMARDLEPVGIRVMTVCPGVLETDIIKNLMATDKNVQMPIFFPKRLGYPEEIAKVVQLIIECPFTNGACWLVDCAYR